VAALQEAGLIDFHPINGPRLDVLGIYPSAETLLAPLVVVAVVVAGFAFNHFGARKLRTSAL